MTRHKFKGYVTDEHRGEGTVMAYVRTVRYINKPMDFPSFPRFIYYIYNDYQQKCVYVCVCDLAPSRRSFMGACWSPLLSDFTRPFSRAVKCSSGKVFKSLLSIYTYCCCCPTTSHLSLVNFKPQRNCVRASGVRVYLPV